MSYYNVATTILVDSDKYLPDAERLQKKLLTLTMHNKITVLFKFDFSLISGVSPLSCGDTRGKDKKDPSNLPRLYHLAFGKVKS